MKNILTTILAVAAISGTAFADGFRCESPEGVRAKVYNHTRPERGTKNLAVVVISDSYGTRYVARNSEMTREFERSRVHHFGRLEDRQDGVKDFVILDIRHTRDSRSLGDLADGENLDGRLTIFDEQTGTETYQLSCERYLKSR